MLPIMIMIMMIIIMSVKGTVKGGEVLMALNQSGQPRNRLFLLGWTGMDSSGTRELASGGRPYEEGSGHCQAGSWSRQRAFFCKAESATLSS